MKSKHNTNVASLIVHLAFAATALLVAIGLTLLGSQLFPELLKKDW